MSGMLISMHSILGRGSFCMNCMKRVTETSGLFHDILIFWDVPVYYIFILNDNGTFLSTTDLLIIGTCQGGIVYFYYSVNFGYPGAFPKWRPLVQDVTSEIKSLQQLC